MAEQLTNISKQVGNINFDDGSAFRLAQAENLEERKGAASIANTDLQNEYLKSSMPSRLRSRYATATKDEAAADVASKTAPYTISNAKVAADYAEPNAAAGLRQAQATATNTQMQPFYKSIDLAIAGNVDEAKAVAGAAGKDVPDSVWQDREYLIALKNGAKYAESAYPNQPAAQSRYMTNTYIPYVQGQRQAGVKVDDPSLPYRAAGKLGDAGTPDVPATPQPAPAPVESTAGGHFELLPGTGKDENGNIVPGIYSHNKDDGTSTFQPGVSVSSRTGAGGNNSTALIRNAEFYVKQGIAPDVATAVNMLRASVNDPATFNRLVQAEKKILRADVMNGAMLSDAELERRAQENVKARRQASGVGAVGGTQPSSAVAAPTFTQAAPAPTPTPSAAPAPAPAASAAPPQGAGTREVPFTATTQQDIDWFKQSAPPGSVISVNGQLYTK